MKSSGEKKEINKKKGIGQYAFLQGTLELNLHIRPKIRRSFIIRMEWSQKIKSEKYFILGQLV